MKPGKVPENVLRRCVLRQIGEKDRQEGLNGAGIGKDCAFFPFFGEGKLVGCMQEAVVLPRERRSETARRGTFEGGEGRAKCASKTVVKLESEAGCASKTGVKLESGAGCASKTVVKLESGAKCASKTGRMPGDEEKCVRDAGQDAEAFMNMADLIQKCANNLAVGGARPAAAMITLLLPEDAEESMLLGLMEEAAAKCRELGMGIAGGQSRITDAVTMPVAVVTGIGKTIENNLYSVNALPGKAAPGQDIVLSKWIGLQGTAVVAKRNREKLFARYPAYLVEEAVGFDRYLSVLPEAEIAVKNGVCAMHDASEGGILGALWEFAEGGGVGLTVDMRKLPLRQETVEVCECCNVNPYGLMSGGCLIMACQDGLGLAAALEAEGIPATVVGKVTDSKERILMNGDEIRYMNRPERDGIYMSGF